MNIKEAAEYLGISVKTLERKIAGGEIAVAYVPGATGKQRTFDRAELDRFKAAEAEKAVATTYVISKSRNFDAPSQALQRAGSVEGMQAFALMVADALREAQTHANDRHDAPPPVVLKDKLMLTEKEAAAYSGLSLADIERARDGLKAIKTGAGWRVKREELERYVKKL
jgi:excisionase family DNA binding protein